MSQPSPGAVPPNPPGSPARWIDRGTTALLVLSLGVVVGVATPALLRAAGADLAVTRAAPLTAPPIVMPHRPPEILAHEDDLEGPSDDDETPPSEPRGQLGLTRGPLVLHERAAGGAAVVGDVQAGEMVTVLRITGDWALVYYGGADGLVVGWAKKSDIAIR